ncbi:MAG: lysophospholipid acyltransferase family protein [bacterium]|nr:lysophospholipid acyltransferase family protein [bacterium]
MTFFLRHAIAQISYTLCWLFLKPLFRFFFDYKIVYTHPIEDIQSPIVVAANHTSALDAFFIGTAFPLFSSILPIRFATAPEHYWRPHYLPMLWLLGSFPIYKKIGLQNSLKYPLSILRHGKSVGIFPEGKRVVNGRPPRARRGVAYLSLVAEVPILPISIQGNRGITLKKILSRSMKVRVIVGSPYSLSPALAHPSAFEEASEYVMQSIKNLQTISH